MRIPQRLLLSPLFLLVLATAGQAATVLYDNPFVFPGGTGAGTNAAVTTAIPSWLVYTGTNGAQHTAASRVFISDRVFKDAPANTFGMIGFDGTGGDTIPKFTFTTGLNINASTPDLTISWLQGNGGTGSGALRIAVQVGGQWYATSSTYSTPGQTVAQFASLTSTTAVNQSFLFSGLASNWNTIDFTAGSALALGGLASSDLSGEITGIGLFTNSVSTANNIRVANLQVTAVPEPSTVALVGTALMGSLMLMRRRRSAVA
jgi:hypothetical protein